MAPKKIGPWMLGERIERGGQAEVYEATRDEGVVIRALKLISAGSSNKKRQRFAQEVRKHVELSTKGSPNVVPIIDHNIDAFEAGERYGYIVMPKAETTLEKQGLLLRLRVELCLEIFRGIVAGIREAHANGIIHRDLKPSNILFMEGSLRTPLIADFGICFVKGTPDDARVTGVHETVGAKFFMAPEQERGGVTDVRERADIYALGKLFHFMLTGRYLYRENLDEAFEDKEIAGDPRLRVVQTQILSRTVVCDPEQRIQSAVELLELVDGLLQKREAPRGGTVATFGPAVAVLPTSNLQVGKLRKAYEQVVKDLDAGRVRGIKVLFDGCLKNFQDRWEQIRSAIERQAEEAPKASRELIRGQPEVTGYTLAIARLDAHDDLFPVFKTLLESIMRSSEGRAGYVAVHTVPHVLAGFLYMAASVGALCFQSWGIFNRLLREKFEWYYQSGRPLYDFGFEHSCFFHSEALGRRASDSHDLFREELCRAEILELLGLTEEEFLNCYVQTHMIMCLRGAQEIQAGQNVHIFADFGRFYEDRVIPLLDKAYNDRRFAAGLCEGFGETPDEWLNRLNDRLKIIRSNFWRGSSFRWESLESYEPR